MCPLNEPLRLEDSVLILDMRYLTLIFKINLFQMTGSFMKKLFQEKRFRSQNLYMGSVPMFCR